MELKPISAISRFGMLAVLLSLFAFAIPREDDPIDKLVAALQKWTTVHPQEKVYLHTDKPYYALGDTIWFKGYITTGSRHQLSAISASVYVDLINEQDSLIRSLKLPATSGMVMGDFTLNDELKEGNYRLRAYTQWMRNAGEEYFFDKTFTVGSVFSNNIITKAGYEYKTVDGKQVLTATLNYTDDQGKPLANKNVQYRIMINKIQQWVKTVKTDANGSIPVSISNEKQVDLTGAYIRTVISNSSGKDVIKDFLIKASLSQSDVQFFPESGNLVNGVVSRVGFKAIGIDGLGINITGKIIDNENHEIADINTLHSGMGSFFLKPEAGKSYTATINFADGSVKSISLPKANDDGYVLSVYQPAKDSVLVRISTKQPLQPVSVNLIVQTGGEIITTQSIKIERSITSFWLDRRAFPTGIVQFNLFDQANQPLNERIAFIRSNDQLQLSLKTSKAIFKSKEPVFFTMDAADSEGKPAVGNYSVSVIDESKLPSDEANESTIFSNLLLTSDLKGYVEKPNYYFTNVNSDVNKALDNLMLTQGYRRFRWNDLNTTITTAPKFAAEGLGTTISGTVKTLGKKVLPGATVTFLSVKAHVTKFATTDSLGRFKFDGFFMTDSIKFTLQARGPKNSNKVIITLDTLPKIRLNKNPNAGDLTTDINGTLKAYIDAGKKQDELYTKMGRMDMVHRLREVEIKAEKAKQNTYALQGAIKIPEGHASRTYIMRDPEKYANLAFALAGKLGPVYFVQNKPYYQNSPMTVVLNGRILTNEDEINDIFDLGVIDPADIVKVDVLYDKFSAMLELYKSGPMIFLYTKPNYQRKTSYEPSVVNIDPKGFNNAREFYSPKYDRPGSNKLLPDMRTTVYWNPYLKTGPDGKASFGFFNADGPGNYKVTVEGIDANGQLGRQVFHYKVDGDLANTMSGLPVTLKDESAKLIANRLDTLSRKLPIEKVYLHTDKPYYNIGDTLWFKSYVTDANQLPSKQSGLLYVELDDDSTEAVRRVTIPIKNGVGWGQIPLPRAIFHEGGYTLRAYTNWMQNFGQDAFFTQRFYLGVPAQTAWLIKSTATIKQVEDKNQLDVDIRLNQGDRSAIALRDVEVKIYEGRYYLLKEQMRTGVDGSLKFSKLLKDKVDGRNIRVQISSLEKADKGKVVQVPLNINRPQKIDLQFLPEGGNLVAGLKSTVGFKAIGEDGKGVAVAGAIYNSKGAKVKEFAAIHNGMGSFDFSPVAGEVYSAKITEPAEATNSYKLPSISSIGTVMHISNPENGESLNVSLSGISKMTGDSACYLIGTYSGRMYYSQKIDAKQSELSIAKDLFPTGIVRFTLLKGKHPLNERAVFIDNKDQLNVRVRTNKQAFKKRDSVGLEVAVIDKSGTPVQGNFSLAIIDNSQVKADSIANYSIATGLLLNSGLKGDIENPGYYIKRKDKDAWLALDNLMLTQGWTGYDWKDVFGPAKEPAFLAEKDFKITGQVTNALNKPVPSAPVLISSQKPNFVNTILADDKGRFTFSNLPQIDSGSFFIQAQNAKGKNMSFGLVTVNKFRAPQVPPMFISSITPWYVNTDTAQLNYVKRVAQKANFDNIKGEGTMLRNVNIKTAKVIKNSLNPYGPGNSDLSFDEKDIKESGVMNLWQLLKQKVPGIQLIGARRAVFRGNEVMIPVFKWGEYVINGGANPRPGTVSMIQPKAQEEAMDDPSFDLNIDGWPVSLGDGESPFEALSEYQIATLKGLEIIFSKKFTNRSVQGPKGTSIPGYRTYEFAKIEITTGNGAGWYRAKSPGTATYRPLPILYPTQFYTPKYKTIAPIVGEPDYRSTIYWEPNLITDANGKARVSFYTSDLPKNYTINIQGISADGYMGSLIQKLPEVKILTSN